jgi:hypothetical protein
MQYLQEVRVDGDTYITDGGKELTTADIGTGFWLLGFDRDGSCFEMTKISRSRAKDIMFDYGNYKLKDLDVTDFGVATYYWNEYAMADGGILKVH